MSEFDTTLKDLIEKLLQLDPLDRLGCPMTGHDMKHLMRHRFFEGFNFSSDLSKTTDVRKALEDSEIAQVLKTPGGLALDENPTE